LLDHPATEPEGKLDCGLSFNSSPDCGSPA
jgi:hypothetical protein